MSTAINSVPSPLFTYSKPVSLDLEGITAQSITEAIALVQFMESTGRISESALFDELMDSDLWWGLSESAIQEIGEISEAHEKAFAVDLRMRVAFLAGRLSNATR